MHELQKLFGAGALQDRSVPLNSSLLTAVHQASVKLLDSLSASFPECPFCQQGLASLQALDDEGQKQFAEAFWKSAAPLKPQLLQKSLPSLEQLLASQSLLARLDLPAKVQTLDQESTEAIWQYVHIIMLFCEVYSVVPGHLIEKLSTVLGQGSGPGNPNVTAKLFQFFQNPLGQMNSLESLGSEFVQAFSPSELVEWERCAGSLTGIFEYLSMMLPSSPGLNPQQLLSALAGQPAAAADPMAMLAGALGSGAADSSVGMAGLVRTLSQLFSPPPSQS